MNTNNVINKIKEHCDLDGRAIDTTPQSAISGTFSITIDENSTEIKFKKSEISDLGLVLAVFIRFFGKDFDVTGLMSRQSASFAKGKAYSEDIQDYSFSSSMSGDNGFISISPKAS